MRDHLILAGAFHKTGTVLLARTFRNLAKALELRFVTGPVQSPPAELDVGFDPRCRFADLAGERPYRAVVCVRDPRDVVISAAHYHCRSAERWLHEPKPGLDGKTYQQYLLGLPNDEERYLAELRRVGRRGLGGMLAFADPAPNVCVTRLETLVVDTELEEFRRIFAFLGFTEAELPACLTAARQASLFGRTGPARSTVHVRSGGRAEQWREAFTPRVMRAWVRRYDGMAERLGYPPSELPRPQRKGAAPAATESVTRAP